MTIYLERLMAEYQLPKNWGRLEQPTVSARVSNPFCGDVIELDLSIVNGQMSNVAYVTVGCAICRASMSLLSEAIKDQTIDQLPYLEGSGILSLLGISLSPTRLKCALLARDAVRAALGQLTINDQQLTFARDSSR